MSFPDAFAHDIVLGPDQVLPTVPRDFGERFTLNWKAARAPDKWWFYDTRMMELWDDALDQLQKATGQNFVNPYRVRPDGAPAPWRPGSAPAPEWQRRLETTDRSTAIDAALKAFDQAREGQFDLPDPRRFEDRVRAESVKLRQDAEKSALASYGAGGLGAFLGAAAGELSHPVNVATLPLGGEYAIANVARMGLLKFLGRNALVEGGVAAASQTAIEALDAPYQERLATDTGIGDRVERVLTAGVGGAILGLGLSGLVAAVRGARFRGRMALDEADALKVAERNVYAAERNPLGPDGANAHARATSVAEVQVSAGRHADIDAITKEELLRQAEAVAEPTREAIITRLRADIARLEARVTDADKIGVVLDPKAEPDALAKARTALKEVEETGRFQGRVLPTAADEAVYRDAVAAVRDAVDVGEDVTLPWLVQATGRPEKDVKRIITRMEREGVIKGEPDAADAFEIDRMRADALLAPPSRPPARSTLEEETEAIFAARMSPTAETHAFDILDSDAATRPIAENAPVPPEKPPTGMKEAKADEARAMVMQKDFEITIEDGTKRMASEIMAEADERLKAAKLAAECAAGGAIG